MRAAVVASLTISLAAFAGGGPDSPDASFTSAWRRARGAGVNVAVIATAGTADALVRSIQARAPGCRAFSEVPGTDERPSRPVRRRASEPDDAGSDAGLARAVDSGVERGARIMLVGFALGDPGERSGEALARAAAAGVLVVAPAGDEGLSHERWPASSERAIGVAALSSSGCLAASTNAGSLTTAAARGDTSFDAAAAITAACALALSLDPELSPADVRRALEAGEPATRPGARGSQPAALDVGALLERLRPRTRSVVVRDARVVPRSVPRGEPGHIRLRVESSGRLPVRGPLVVRIEGLHEVEVPFGPLAPGESVELEATFVPRVLHPASVRRTVDGGLLVGSPLLAVLQAPGAVFSLAVEIVPGRERPPCLSIVRASAAAGLRVRTLVENSGAAVEEDALVRLVGAGGAVLDEVTAPRLEPGERTWVALAGTLEGLHDRRLDAAIELVRAPRGFREAVHARWPLVLDPRGARVPRRGSRR